TRAAAGGRLRRRVAPTPLTPGFSAHAVDGLWHAESGASRPRGRFVGRREELALLESRLAAAGSGRGQVIGITGDAGIGKSRLLVELAASPGLRGAHLLEGRCLPAETHTPFFPLLQIVRTVC